MRKDSSSFFSELHPEKPGERKGAQESNPTFQFGEQQNVRKVIRWAPGVRLAGVEFWL